MSESNILYDIISKREENEKLPCVPHKDMQEELRDLLEFRDFSGKLILQTFSWIIPLHQSTLQTLVFIGNKYPRCIRRIHLFAAQVYPV